MKPASRSPKPLRRLLLVGGAGRMGRLFARFFRRRGFEVAVADPAGVPRGYRAASLEEAATAEVVIMAASLSKSAEAMRAVLSRRPRGLVLDIASVKAPIFADLKRACQEGIAVASVHPMFGPDVRSFHGRDLIVCDAGDASATRRARRLFAGVGLKIRTIPLHEHDRWVSATMGLAHFVALAAASTLAATGVDLSDVDGLASTSFRRLLEFIEPFLSQASELTYAIQRESPEGGPVRDLLTAEVRAWSEAVTRGDFGAFDRRVEDMCHALAGPRSPLKVRRA